MKKITYNMSDLIGATFFIVIAIPILLYLWENNNLRDPEFKVGDCFANKVKKGEFLSTQPSYYHLVLKVGKESYLTELFRSEERKSLGEIEYPISLDSGNELVDSKFCKDSNE